MYYGSLKVGQVTECLQEEFNSLADSIAWQIQ
jgi:hypothetical protein